ncbi:MAG: glycosyltransferase family 1 protein [Acidobacteriota bacterium]|nr:glycosyltransferase family 1 protein [Acidobacteriota bacterium]
MRIVLDFRPALRQSTGVGTYAHNLILALAKSFPEDSYTAFTASWRDRANLSVLPEVVEVTDWRIPVRVLDWTWNRLQWPSVERLVGNIDIAHSPSPMLLPARRARTIITVHDCYFMRHPEDVFGPIRRDYVPLARRAAEVADAIVVVSETTAIEAEDLLGIGRDKIHVTPLGVRQEFFRAPAANHRFLRRYGIDRPFLLFVGRREKRKDLDTLLQAFDELSAETDDLQLLLVGPDAPGWGDTWANTSDRVRQRTRIAPHQSMESLLAIYAAATALVMPSRWEGFGLTGLEAMATGTPVIASEVGSLPEVLGSAALFAPPKDSATMAEQCRQVLHDTTLATELGNEGRKHAASFRWSRTAQRTNELYHSLGG